MNHPKHGKQFKVERCEQVLPATIEGLKKYLGSGLIKGVGPVTAGRIVKKFGLQTLDVLDHHPEQLRQVLGVELCAPRPSARPGYSKKQSKM